MVSSLPAGRCFFLLFFNAMTGPYSTYFDNPFLALRMARPAFKEQAQHVARAVRDAKPGAAFDPLLTALDTAIAGFDDKLTDRVEPTAADTEAYRRARKDWLTFVDDAMKDNITPKLRKLPVYADFKKFGKSRLSGLDQANLLIQSQQLIDLYTEHQTAVGRPTLAAEAAAKLKAVADLDALRDKEDATTTLILDLATDRAAIARAQRRLKAQLELTFDDPAKVYSFFDFSQTQLPKAKKKTDVPPQA